MKDQSETSQGSEGHLWGEHLFEGGTTMTPPNLQEVSGPKLVSLAKAAQQFGVSVKTLRRRIADGTIRGYRVGRLIRVDLDELREKLLVEIPSVR